MRSSRRSRRYVHPTSLAALKPFFRYSLSRDAHVLRLGGNRMGPVLRADRRRRQMGLDHPDRRGMSHTA